jgi:hypothetical protein
MPLGEVAWRAEGFLFDKMLIIPLVCLTILESVISLFQTGDACSRQLKTICMEAIIMSQPVVRFSIAPIA